MKPYILLIEDDQWLAESYQMFLTTNGGYETMVSNSGRTAMDIIDERIPDVIVADVLLGDHNIFTLFQELQSYDDTAKIPIILCTGLDTLSLSARDLKHYGITAVFDKSKLTPDQLLLAVQEQVKTGRG